MSHNTVQIVPEKYTVVIITTTTLTVATLLVITETGHDLIVSVVVRYEEWVIVKVGIICKMLVAVEVGNKGKIR